jgi:hypothetical protein
MPRAQSLSSALVPVSQAIIRSGLFSSVHGHCHAIVIGRRADRGSASRDPRFRRRSRTKPNRIARNSPTRDFESESGSIPVERFCRIERHATCHAPRASLPIYFCWQYGASGCRYFCRYRQQSTKQNGANSNCYGIMPLPARGTKMKTSMKTIAYMMVRFHIFGKIFNAH